MPEVFFIPNDAHASPRTSSSWLHKCLIEFLMSPLSTYHAIYVDYNLLYYHGHMISPGARSLTLVPSTPRSDSATVPRCHDWLNTSTNLRTPITTPTPSTRLYALLSPSEAVPSPPIDCFFYHFFHRSSTLFTRTQPRSDPRTLCLWTRVYGTRLIIHDVSIMLPHPLCARGGSLDRLRSHATTPHFTIYPHHQSLYAPRHSESLSSMSFTHGRAPVTSTLSLWAYERRVRRLAYSVFFPPLLYFLRVHGGSLSTSPEPANLPRMVFSVQEEPPSRLSNGDDNMGLESFSELDQDNLSLDMDEEEKEDEEYLQMCLHLYLHHHERHTKSGDGSDNEADDDEEIKREIFEDDDDNDIEDDWVDPSVPTTISFGPPSIHLSPVTAALTVPIMVHANANANPKIHEKS
ncbi:hypothetical protein C0995_005814 [Termitomyces sp. Mi166|nr:hypothetical protein C0995_005814 [Termitomyces sp. Mi166\